MSKRQKELAREQRRVEKVERRVKRAAEKDGRPDKPTGSDPDIEGIVPGPQPLQEE